MRKKKEAEADLIYYICSRIWQATEMAGLLKATPRSRARNPSGFIPRSCLGFLVIDAPNPGRERMFSRQRFLPSESGSLTSNSVIVSGVSVVLYRLSSIDVWVVIRPSKQVQNV